MDHHNPLCLASARHKIRTIEEACHQALLGHSFFVPQIPGRDVSVVLIKDLPKKRGLSTQEGQARLLHDLASIELQAMELGFRTLIEYPDSPQSFREQLVDVILDESRHLELCLNEMERLGFPWGSWAVHIGLWQSVSSEDDFLDRLLIVHRYLEGSGLDAGEKILARLQSESSRGARQIVSTIAQEEVGHVLFGSNWYRRECQARGADPDHDFKKRSSSLFPRLPRRLEPINAQIRLQAGFSLAEIEVLQSIQQSQMN